MGGSVSVKIVVADVCGGCVGLPVFAVFLVQPESIKQQSIRIINFFMRIPPYLYPLYHDFPVLSCKHFLKFWFCLTKTSVWW